MIFYKKTVDRHLSQEMKNKKEAEESEFDKHLQNLWEKSLWKVGAEAKVIKNLTMMITTTTQLHLNGRMGNLMGRISILLLLRSSSNLTIRKGGKSRKTRQSHLWRRDSPKLRPKSRLTIPLKTLIPQIILKLTSKIRKISWKYIPKRSMI